MWGWLFIILAVLGIMGKCIEEQNKRKRDQYFANKYDEEYRNKK